MGLHSLRQIHYTKNYSFYGPLMGHGIVLWVLRFSHLIGRIPCLVASHQDLPDRQFAIGAIQVIFCVRQSRDRNARLRGIGLESRQWGEARSPSHPFLGNAAPSLPLHPDHPRDRPSTRCNEIRRVLAGHLFNRN